MTEDLLQKTIKAGYMTIWEEVAHDGAQAKTLLTASQRIKLARAQGAMFGEHGAHHLLFNAGFPSVCREEFEIVR